MLYTDQVGIAKLTVVDVTKDDYTFDPIGSNLLENSIEINNPSFLGDINRDGDLNLLDVDPFVALIANGEYQFEADVNEDGVVDLHDIQPFVALLSN